LTRGIYGRRVNERSSFDQSSTDGSLDRRQRPEDHCRLPEARSESVAGVDQPRTVDVGEFDAAVRLGDDSVFAGRQIDGVDLSRRSRRVDDDVSLDPEVPGLFGAVRGERLPQ
jgi:hypothetical protein